MAANRLDAVFAALADPTRRAILARLADERASVTARAAPFEMSLPAISKLLKLLERAGLIARSRAAQWRPCRLEAAPLKDAAAWLERYRRFSEQSFDRLDDYLKKLQAKGAIRGCRRCPRARFDPRVRCARALVFRAWTQQQHAAQWWGPEGFTTVSCRIDARPGGAYRLAMRGRMASCAPRWGLPRGHPGSHRVQLRLGRCQRQSRA